MKGPEISLQKNLIKQGTLSLERKDAVGEGWDGVFNYQMGCMWKNIFFFSLWVAPEVRSRTRRKLFAQDEDELIQHVYCI